MFFQININIMQYCPPNITLSEVWINHGTSQCFMDTVSNSIIAGFIFAAGTAQLCMYRKYGSEVSENQLSRSKLYYVQIFFTLFIPVLEITRFVLQATFFNDKQIYGYMVSSIFNCFCVCQNALYESSIASFLSANKCKTAFAWLLLCLGNSHVF